MTTPPLSSPSRSWLGVHWARWSVRERRAVTLAAVVVGGAVLWSLALAPALRTLQSAPQRQAALHAQWQQMVDLQAQARTLQQAPRASAAAAQQQLRALTERLLGSQATLQIQSDQATLQVRQVPAEALSQWLIQLRSATQAHPVTLQLQRAASPASVASTLPAPMPAPSASASTLAPTGLQAGPSAQQQIPNALAAHATRQPVPAPVPAMPPAVLAPAVAGVFWNGQITLALPAQ